jgi:hypothetical protein
VKFLSRFQRLERPRREGEPARQTTGERFRAIEPLAPLPDARSGDLARFAPRAEPALQLEPRSDAQPFVRCPSCGVDWPLGVRRCACGTALDTLEAVAFNTALWDRHREEVARHDTERVRARNEDLADARREQDERRALGEALAQEIAEREGMPRHRPPSRSALALGVLAVLGLVLLPRGPLARGVFAFLLGVLCVRLVVSWVRSRPGEIDPGGGSSVDR